MRSVLLFSLLVLGCTPPTEAEECTATVDGGASPVHGEIIEGKEGAPGATLSGPHKGVVLVHTTIPIVEVRVGGVPARLTSVGEQRWEAQLFTNDLEAHRENGLAQLDVIATDRCGRNYTLDTASIALGPAPGIAVTGLVITESHTPAECYVPSGGVNASLVDVTAELASTGAKVTLHASQGLFDDGTATREVVLVNAGAKAHASAFFVPGAAGSATLTATALGASADPVSLLVVDAPTLTGPTNPMVRGVTYTTTVTTAGNLDTCVIEEIVAGAATVNELEPTAGPVTGTVSIRQSPMSCTALERARFSITFDAAAPDGAAVTLRCYDTYNRSVASTFAVQPLPVPPSTP